MIDFETQTIRTRFGTRLWDESLGLDTFLYRKRSLHKSMIPDPGWCIL